MQTTVSANIIVSGEDDEVIGRYCCNSSVLNAMFNSIAAAKNYNIAIDNNVSELSENMIIDTLLLVNKVFFKVNEDDKAIEYMEVEQK